MGPKDNWWGLREGGTNRQQWKVLRLERGLREKRGLTDRKGKILTKTE